MKQIINQGIDIQLGKITLKGELYLPVDAQGIVVFSHGSGSSHLSSRNQKVAGHLQKHGFGSFLFDLLTEAENEYYPNRFNIPLLTDRLVSTTEFLKQLEITHHLSFGYFGSSIGAAPALKAAVRLPYIGAVVSRGGRADLAGDTLPLVKTPTLLIVGSLDEEILELNLQTLDRIPGSKQLEVIIGANHLFEGPGMLNKVAHLANKWFTKYLTNVKSPRWPPQTA